MSTYIVTGGAGFIGSNLAEMLIQKGHTVHIIDNLVSGKKENIPNGAEFHNVDIISHDDLNNVCSSIKNLNGIFHLAALPRVQYSIEHPIETHTTNVTGTLNVLLAANKYRNVKVVFAASSSAYGNTTDLPTNEDVPTSPISPYALHKYIGERYMKLFADVYNVPTISLRFFNVYGPKCDPHGPYALVIGKFIEMRKKDEPMTITGDGSQTRDAVHVSDVARALLLAMQNENVHSGEVINIGSGTSRSINKVAELIGGPTVYIEPRLEVHDTLADITLAKKLLKWEPLKSFEEGVSELKHEMGLDS